MGKIYGLSTPPDLTFCVSSSKDNVSLYGKGFRKSRDSKEFKYLSHNFLVVQAKS